MMQSRLGNLLIDTADRLAACTSDDETWNAVTSIGRKIGANGIGAAGFEQSTGKTVWARFSLDQKWQDEYAEAELYTVDPIIACARHRPLPPLIRERDNPIKRATNVQSALLFDLHSRHRYLNFCCHSWNDSGENKIIVFTTEDDPEDMFGPGTRRALRAISALLAAHLKSPGTVDQAYIIGANYQNFSQIETEVLCLLAKGSSYMEIAEHLSISEAMLQKHLNTAREKMGAETPEQALALAIARRLLPL